MKKSNQFLPIPRKANIFLAGSDTADCHLFKEPLEELPVLAQLTIFHTGEPLMKRITKK